MPEPYVLLTAAEIGPDAFAGFLTRVGGSLKPDHNDAGRVSQERCHVWIYLNPESLDDIDADIRERLAAKLRGAPKSSLVLELSSAPGSDKLAIEVAIAFAKEWTAVLWDIETEILDLAELRRLQREGKGLPQTKRT
jgi:hypothetical protein